MKDDVLVTLAVLSLLGRSELTLGPVEVDQDWLKMELREGEGGGEANNETEGALGSRLGGVLVAFWAGFSAPGASMP